MDITQAPAVVELLLRGQRGEVDIGLLADKFLELEDRVIAVAAFEIDPCDGENMALENFLILSKFQMC